MYKKRCPDCFGNGYFESSNSRMITKCPKCKGIGVVNYPPTDKTKRKPSNHDKNNFFLKENVFE